LSCHCETTAGLPRLEQKQKVAPLLKWPSNFSNPSSSEGFTVVSSARSSVNGSRHDSQMFLPENQTIMVTDRIMEKKTLNLDRRRLRPIFP